MNVPDGSILKTCKITGGNVNMQINYLHARYSVVTCKVIYTKPDEIVE